VISNQFTIKKKVSFSGVGLHSGEQANIVLHPEETDKGISFYYEKKKICATWKNGQISQLCTTLKKGNFRLSTIEHLMSALSGLGISNIIIETSSSEVPILDGSAREYVDEILKVGLIDQKKTKKFLKIKKKVLFKSNNKFIEINPIAEQKFIIDCTIDYKDDFIKKQNLTYEHSVDNYKKIYKARTFCLHKDLEQIFSMGLARGGTLDNAIVVSGNRILNQGGLRYKDEFVKHKILDCIGDLYLAEHQILGQLITIGGGHEINLILLREIFKDKDNYNYL